MATPRHDRTPLAYRLRPFDIKAPNVITRDAIAELEAGHGEKFSNVDDLMADLRADD